MKVTVEVPENVIYEAVHASIASAFLGTNYDSGQGRAAIKAQVVQWAQEQDYTAEIEKQAPAIVRSVVADELAKVIKTLVKREVKAMKDGGELGSLFDVGVNE